ncbi:MAG: UvrD-helicase domain-containing protein, partial [Propioniciclava sp.]|nr:UvrD-helicase domain-containing protein [Propioniciclava sp.]
MSEACAGMVAMVNVVADATGPVLVLGAAGTGKTTLLVEAMADRIRAGGTQPLVFA